MTVKLVKVAPGIALSPTEAAKLKGEIQTFLATPGLTRGKVTWNNFRDDQDRKRIVEFIIRASNGNDVDVELLRFDRR